MNEHYVAALAIGSCILIGCGVIGIAFGTLPGFLAGAASIIIGGRFLNQSLKLARKE